MSIADQECARSALCLHTVSWRRRLVGTGRICGGRAWSAAPALPWSPTS